MTGISFKITERLHISPTVLISMFNVESNTLKSLQFEELLLKYSDIFYVLHL